MQRQKKSAGLLKESTIQTQIIKQLKASGWLVNKIIQCTLNGTPDIIALKNGRCIFIEVKREGAKPTPLQQYRHKELRDQQFEVYTINNITQLCTINI